MSNDEQPAVVAEILRIRRVRIRPNLKQPREYFDKQALAELARSIHDHGQDEPVIVRRIEGDPDHDFGIVSGERRWRACGIADLEFVEVRIKDIEEGAPLYIEALRGNTHRANLVPIEEARAIQKGIDEGCEKEDLVQAMGFGLQTLEDRLRLLQLPKKVQDLMEPSVPKEERLSLAVVKKLIGLPGEFQVKVAQKAVRDGMSSWQVGEYIRTLLGMMGIERPGVSRGGVKDRQQATLFRFVSMLEHELGAIMSMPDAGFRSLFRRMEPAYRDLLREMMEEFIQELAKLQRMLDELKQSSGSATQGPAAS